MVGIYYPLDKVETLTVGGAALPTGTAGGGEIKPFTESQDHPWPTEIPSGIFTKIEPGGALSLSASATMQLVIVPDAAVS